MLQHLNGIWIVLALLNINYSLKKVVSSTLRLGRWQEALAAVFSEVQKATIHNLLSSN